MRLPLETPDATHSEIHAYILGAGITSLSAAVHLLQEGHLPASHIHILETLDQAGGGTVSSGNAEEGYHYRAGGMPFLNGDAMATLFAEVPSDVNPGKSVLDDLYEYWGLPVATAGQHHHQQRGGLGEEQAQHPHQQQQSQCHQTRLIRRSKHGLVRIDCKHSTSLGLRDRVEVFRFMNKSEVTLGRSRIRDHFGKGFFGGSYWGVLSTTFGFKPCHSAAEFHRALHKFGHDIASVTSSHPRPLDGGQYNRHESLVAPIARFLRRQGVDFQFQTTVTDIIFADDDAAAGPEPLSAAASNSGSASASVHTTPSTRQRKRSSRHNSNENTQKAEQQHLPPSTEPPYPPRLVSAIIAHPLNGPEQTIPVQPHDIVLVSLGSAMSGSSLGSNTTAPPLYQMEADHELDENWLLWLELTTKDPRRLGNAYNFCTRLEESRLESFTITLRAAGGNRIRERITGTNNNSATESSSSPMFISLIDAPWVVSLHVPPQPVFPDQPAEVQVLWGYALYPERTGEVVRKPMLECTGEEILREVLAQLEVKETEADRILQGAITVPCVVPRMAAGLLPRGEGNRPRVIPPAIRNLGLIGQFVEIEGETGVTAMEYSVLGAQMAVRKLVGRVSAVLGEGEGERKAVPGGDKEQQQQHKAKESRKRSWLPLPCS
ncbi:oleate hydratase [Aspergillus aculeatinus CBS 121060]|uniref:67 kDa myosin-cross-reactive antigen like protein n=1 Tax=Aspergillus aculeatinus CBS 121060 TaxID=1448322 RepID=A0ACD1GVU9_9EURO|nr:67 kDa myosin-cross-reactive antigen like protein [Aspergillus aculeatinus CBS 121060]RAH65397.1 67 kDa myosin-cross-reactive antigen like protein [Aspergillus aculeatinus CBS 121060]